LRYSGGERDGGEGIRDERRGMRDERRVMREERWGEMDEGRWMRADDRDEQ
jgi:hypothetical protein